MVNILKKKWDKRPHSNNKLKDSLYSIPIILACGFTLLSVQQATAQSSYMSYPGNDAVIKNPERGLSFKAGFVDLPVSGFVYSGLETGSTCEDFELEFDKCFIEENGISMVEVEKYVRFKQSDIAAGNIIFDPSSVIHVKGEYNKMKALGLKAHHVMNSDFDMKAKNTDINVPNDIAHDYLENIMDATNTAIYEEIGDLIAVNSLGWIGGPEELNLYRLEPEWLQYKWEKRWLHPFAETIFYGDRAGPDPEMDNKVNNDGTKRHSSQRGLFRFCTSVANPNFTYNGNFSGGVAGEGTGIQHYQETVMKRIGDYFPGKKMLAAEVIAWEHKFTHPQNGNRPETKNQSTGPCSSFYVDCGEDEFNVNPNLGYYDRAFATTYDHIATLSDGPQDQSPDYTLSNETHKLNDIGVLEVNDDYNPNLLTVNSKKDLFVLGKYSDRFWMHADMPVYFDDATFEYNFGFSKTQSSPKWENNFQYNYDAFKGMLTASGDYQDPILAAKKLFMFNYTSFDITHNNSEDIGKKLYQLVEPNGNGAIDRWKDTPMTKEIADANKLPYSSRYFLRHNKTVYDYIRDHLGYRLEMKTLSAWRVGNTLTTALTLENHGFASPKNKRDIKVLLLNSAGDIVQTKTYGDNETWLEWSTSSNLNAKKDGISDANYQDFTLTDDIFTGAMNYNTHSITVNFDVSSLAANEDYSIALYMPDPSSTLNNLANKADYAVKLANNGMIIGDRGENILASFNTSNYAMKHPNYQEVSSVHTLPFSTAYTGTVNATGDIVIQDGVTLTVSGTLNMPAHSRIKVLVGGKLIVDGGTITNNCIETWKGIEVVGNNAERQLVSKQGKVELKNGARIEYADNGVKLYEAEYDGSINWGTSGGIIVADDATFFNCRRGVAFMSFHNESASGQPRGNVSSFTDCKFQFTDLFNDLYRGEDYIPVGISMWDVDRVRIKGCDFVNEITSVNSSTITHNKYEGTAIRMHDASPRITPMYSSAPVFPQVPIQWNTFTGFDIGVYSSGANGTNTITIRDNRFYQNKAGIYLENSLNSKIVENQFNIPDLDFGDVNDEVRSTGVYLAGSADFVIEENTFTGGSSSSQNRDGGLAIQDMFDGSIQNADIYKNDFNNLGYGFLAYGKNGGTFNIGGITTHRGVKLGCNNFGQDNFNNQDWYMDAESSINPIQGTAISPTGNTFGYDATNSSNFENIFEGNTGSNGLDLEKYYHYTTAGHAPSDNNLEENVVTDNTEDFEASVDCPSNLSDDFEVLSGDLSPLLDDIIMEEVEFELLSQNFKQILNGGVKPEIMSILLDVNKTSKEVRDELILGSPYLEDDVLIAAIYREIPLTQWHLTEVLIWNSSLSRRVMAALNDVQPLTPFQFGLVKNADNGSQRFLLEMAIHEKEIKIDRLRSDYISKAWSCEEVNVYDEMIKLYDTKVDMASVAICIDAELSNKNYEKADLRLSNFMTLESNSDFSSFYELKIELKKENRNWFQLSETESRLLDNLSASNSAFISSKVKSIKQLISGDNKTFKPLPINLYQSQNKKAYIGKPSDESFENVLEVKYIANDKILMFICTRPGSTFQIINNMGQTVETGRLINAFEQKDVSYLQTGAYHIRMTSPDNKTNYHDKFIVQ